MTEDYPEQDQNLSPAADDEAQLAIGGLAGQAIIDDRLNEPREVQIEKGNPVEFDVEDDTKSGDVIDKSGSGTYIVYPKGAVDAVQNRDSVAMFVPYRVKPANIRAVVRHR